MNITVNIPGLIELAEAIKLHATNGAAELKTLPRKPEAEAEAEEAKPTEKKEIVKKEAPAKKETVTKEVEDDAVVEDSIEPSVTFEEIRAKANELGKAKGKPAVIEVLKAFKVKGLQGVEKERYDDFYGALEEALNE